MKVSFELYASEYPGHAISLASELAREGYNVIGAGGDGTCNEVLNGVITSSTGVLCGFIPMGSGNDIPGAIGIPPHIKRACEIIAENKSGRVDVGVAVRQEDKKRYFLGIGSQGFCALVTKKTNEGKKGLNGTRNYEITVIKTLFGWKNKEIKVTMDNDVHEGPANLVAVGNGPSYGGWMYMCQNARVNDGLFHISVVNMGKLKLLTDFNKMYKARTIPHPCIREYTSKNVIIEMVNGTDDPYICQVDGEVLGSIPVKYEISEDGCEFIKPIVDEVAEAFKKKHDRYFYDPIL